MKSCSVVSFTGDVSKAVFSVNEGLCLPFIMLFLLHPLFKTTWDLSVLKYLTGSQGVSKMPSYISRRFSYTLNMQIKCITESPSAVINRINLRWRSQSQLENLRSRRKCWGLDEGPEPLRVYCRQNTGAGSLTKALHSQSLSSIPLLPLSLQLFAF